MTYEELKRAWVGALHHSGLINLKPELERMDLVQLDRTAQWTVALREDQIEPFTIGADVWWTWASSLSARTTTTEEDFVTELVGIKASRPKTERPWLRVDAEIFTTLPYGRSHVFPSERFATWSKDVVRKIVALDPKPARVSERMPPQLKWQGAPAAQVRADANGIVRVERIDLNAWQGIALPRRWSDPKRKPDPHPGPALDQMFKRLEDSLKVWTAATLELLGTRSEKVTDKRKPVTGSPPVMATPNSSSPRRMSAS